jgi:hypothetical protein
MQELFSGMESMVDQKIQAAFEQNNPNTEGSAPSSGYISNLPSDNMFAPSNQQGKEGLVQLLDNSNFLSENTLDPSNVSVGSGNENGNQNFVSQDNTREINL